MTGFDQAEQRRRLGALRAEQIRRLDSAAVAAGVPVEVLMETAGWQLARAAWRLLGRTPGAVLVCAGRGNNGGDALVAARHLCGWGCEVATVMVLGDGEPSPVVDEQRRRLSAAATSRQGGDRVSELRSPDQIGALRGRVDAARLVVDGLLGSGLQGAPRPFDAAVIAALVHERVLSVDVPSGLSVDDGLAAGGSVRAHTTCTLTAMKHGLWGAPARRLTGRLLVADIGMPPVAWTRTGIAAPTAVRGGALVRVPAPFN